MASFRHLARGQLLEWGAEPETLFSGASVAIKKCRAVALLS